MTSFRKFSLPILLPQNPCIIIPKDQKQIKSRILKILKCVYKLSIPVVGERSQKTLYVGDPDLFPNTAQSIKHKVRSSP